MNFNRHSDLEGSHAFLGASQYHWLNYDDEKLRNSYINMKAKEKGTELHALAATLIHLGQKLPKSNKTLNQYVNDAIGFHMTPEQILFYSYNCFGTADAICYKPGLLRVHDLKTGVVIAHEEQLYIYDALFCLEYKINPLETEFANRIYQNDDVKEFSPEPELIKNICDKIIHNDKIIDKIKFGED